MARDIADEEIRDTNSYTYTVENSGDSPVTFQYINGLDAEVTIVVEATYDDDSDNFDDAITLESGKTVSATSNDYDTMGYPWDYVKFTVTASSSPSSGSLVIKKME